VSLVFALWFLFISTMIWAMYCNSKTCTQRNRIIDVLYAQEDWDILRDYYKSISYDKHLWYLMTFRNPMKLYPAVLQDAVK
jgi:hypothetical protein